MQQGGGGSSHSPRQLGCRRPQPLLALLLPPPLLLLLLLLPLPPPRRRLPLCWFATFAVSIQGRCSRKNTFSSRSYSGSHVLAAGTTPSSTSSLASTPPFASLFLSAAEFPFTSLSWPGPPTTAATSSSLSAPPSWPSPASLSGVTAAATNAKPPSVPFFSSPPPASLRGDAHWRATTAAALESKGSRGLRLPLLPLLLLAVPLPGSPRSSFQLGSLSSQGAARLDWLWSARWAASSSAATLAARSTPRRFV
mmetsp:Transcript_83371/g.162233  ORF Transcript_83371/g.162233 Transcript_83371/m.162233 type:complete len:252 (+) Transcript_83371:1834-2589(+)